jgi:hypothetical protein
MRRITIITTLLAAALVPAASAHAAGRLSRADAERIAVRHIQSSASSQEANGAYVVIRTSRRCHRVTARRIACNFALFLRGLTPQATDTACVSTVYVVLTPRGRIIKQTWPLVCGRA